ncbi:MAG: sugar phosphate isomerase/epimerase [Bacteroidetes bacterium]|nr:MAG: sugar phosphate isomerase/epimerase [Bacteroidota bacterium]
MKKATSSRRQFVKTTLLATTGAVLTRPARFFKPAAPPEHIGVQLYSVRDDMAKDPRGTVAAVAQSGYKEVEAYNFQEGQLFGMPYPEFGRLLKANGLTMPSTHANISLVDFNDQTGDISDSVKKWVDAAPELGLRYITCPSMSEQDYRQMPKMIKLFTAMGNYCRKAGVRFAYHNHDYEYTQSATDGRLLIEWLLHEIDPAIMAMQMDIYWVRFAQHNPLDWFRLYPGRWELCHAKDMADTPTRETIEVGAGTIDFKTIFSKSAAAGMKYYIVELEHYRTTPLDGIGKARKGMLELF